MGGVWSAVTAPALPTRAIDTDPEVPYGAGVKRAALAPTRPPRAPAQHRQVTNILGLGAVEWPHDADFWSRYERGALLGEGSFGQVYDVVNRDNGRRLVLKVLRVGLQSDDMEDDIRPLQYLERLAAADDGQYPRQLMRYVEHMTVPDPDEPEARRFALLMEDAGGIELAAFVKEQRASDPAWQPSPQFARSVFRDLLVALEYLHRHGIVHRDIKPENIMIGRNGEATLIDLGLSCFTDATGATAQRCDNAATLEYGTECVTLSPARQDLAATQRRRAPLPDPSVLDEAMQASDLWAVGLTMLYLLSGGRENPICDVKERTEEAWLAKGAGQLATSRAVTRAVRAAVRSYEPPAARHLYAADPALAQLVRRLLTRTDADRPTAAEALRELDRQGV